MADIVPAVLGTDPDVPTVLPEIVLDASAVVLLVFDGLGAEQLQARAHVAPTLNELHTATITTVAPTTTATALTSIATGVPPGRHGVVGYRIRTQEGNLNVLRWKTPVGDAVKRLVPEEFQCVDTFACQRPPVLQKPEYARTGFSRAYLGDARHVGYKSLESLPPGVLRLLRSGESFVYAYYEGIDVAAHEHGFNDKYEAQLRACDQMLTDLLCGLPRDVAVVATSDHGLVDCSGGRVELDQAVLDHAAAESGEARFRWLHARPGHSDLLLEAARHAHGEQAWVVSVEEVTDAGWFGPDVTTTALARLGDVALVARDGWAFDWPGQDRESSLVGRHGSLTAAEMLVPLVTYVT